MGRIKSTFVKSSGEKIYKMGGSDFTDNFEENKSIITKYVEIPSKRLRNSVVGYITRLVKKSNKSEN